MSTVLAYFDGTAFVPVEALSFPQGKVVSLTVGEEQDRDRRVAVKLARLAEINSNLEKLNATEPLPTEFDDILSRRLNFSKVLDL